MDAYLHVSTRPKLLNTVSNPWVVGDSPAPHLAGPPEAYMESHGGARGTGQRTPSEGRTLSRVQYPILAPLTDGDRDDQGTQLEPPGERGLGLRGIAAGRQGRPMGMWGCLSALSFCGGSLTTSDGGGCDWLPKCVLQWAAAA